MMSFGHRYCAAFQGRFGWDFTGASNLQELNVLLRSTMLIRRLKLDVLKVRGSVLRCSAP